MYGCQEYRDEQNRIWLYVSSTRVRGVRSYYNSVTLVQITEDGVETGLRINGGEGTVLRGKRNTGKRRVRSAGRWVGGN